MTTPPTRQEIDALVHGPAESLRLLPETLGALGEVIDYAEHSSGDAVTERSCRDAAVLIAAQHNHITALTDALRALAAERDTLAEAALVVMVQLRLHGPSVVPHLLDTDDNAGRRLLDLIDAARRAEGASHE